MVSSETGEIEYFSPDPRAVLPLDDFHVPRSLARVVRQQRFRVTTDTCFEGVMRACAAPRRSDPGTWIDERLIEAYVELHERGLAHSVESWSDDALVGGLYGVHLGAAFFGESMFSLPEQGGRDASKVALVHLIATLRTRGFRLLDTQFTNHHLEQFGCTEIPRRRYLERLAHALASEASWPEPGPLPPLCDAPEP